MYINNINNHLNTNFNALKKVSCSGKGSFFKCNSKEERLIDELEKHIKVDAFFEKYDVKAYIEAFQGNAKLVLNYKPVANNLKEKFKNFFKPTRNIILTGKHPSCTEEAAYYLAKKIRSVTSFEKLI